MTGSTVNQFYNAVSAHLLSVLFGLSYYKTNDRGFHLLFKPMREIILLALISGARDP